MYKYKTRLLVFLALVSNRQIRAAETNQPGESAKTESDLEKYWRQTRERLTNLLKIAKINLMKQDQPQSLKTMQSMIDNFLKELQNNPTEKSWVVTKNSASLNLKISKEHYGFKCHIDIDCTKNSKVGLISQNESLVIEPTRISYYLDNQKTPSMVVELQSNFQPIIEATSNLLDPSRKPTPMWFESRKGLYRMWIMQSESIQKYDAESQKYARELTALVYSKMMFIINQNAATRPIREVENKIYELLEGIPPLIRRPEDNAPLDQKTKSTKILLVLLDQVQEITQSTQATYKSSIEIKPEKMEAVIEGVIEGVKTALDGEFEKVRGRLAQAKREIEAKFNAAKEKLKQEDNLTSDAIHQALVEMESDTTGIILKEVRTNSLSAARKAILNKVRREFKELVSSLNIIYNYETNCPIIIKINTLNQPKEQGSTEQFFDPILEISSADCSVRWAKRQDSVQYKTSLVLEKSRLSTQSQLNLEAVNDSDTNERVKHYWILDNLTLTTLLLQQKVLELPQQDFLVSK